MEKFVSPARPTPWRSYARRLKLMRGFREMLGGTPFKTSGNRAQRARQLGGMQMVRGY